GRLALAGLIICELFLFAAVLLSTTGVLFWAALAMLIPTLAFTWQLQGGAGGCGALGASLQRVNGKQIDLRLGNEKHSDDPAIQEYVKLNERLRAIMLELQQNSLGTALASANSRLLAEQAARDAQSQQQVSELIFHASEQ